MKCWKMEYQIQESESQIVKYISAGAGRELKI